MASIRQPAVAGQFYPGDAKHLKDIISNYLSEVPEVESPRPKAIIAPHAGYIYSGPIAATAYAHLAQSNGEVSRVVLLGPAHWVPIRGLAASQAAGFATPLGVVPVDAEVQEAILSLDQVEVREDAHAREHSLEVQLPFLQTIFTDFSLLPLVVGQATPEEVAEILETVWGGSETVIVISSDLSHYHNYESARALDEATSKTIEELRPLEEGQACGGMVINGLLPLASERGLVAKTVDLRSSGDTAGPRDRVVGYGAYTFC